MTLAELFKQFRSDVDDTVTPYLWKNADLESYVNWALGELARKAMYFFDTTTWASVPVTADDAQVAATAANKLSRILFIRRATLGSTNDKIGVFSMHQAGEGARDTDYGRFLSSSAWETTTGTPAAIITDYYEDGSLRLGPIPVIADTLSLWAFRLPLQNLSLKAGGKLDLETAGVSDISHQLTLIQGMKVRAYLKDDTETRDLKMAAEAETRFGQELRDIKREKTRQRSPAGVTRYGGL